MTVQVFMGFPLLDQTENVVFFRITKDVIAQTTLLLSRISDRKTLFFFTCPTANNIAGTRLSYWLLLFSFGLIKVINHLLKFCV